MNKLYSKKKNDGFALFVAVTISGIIVFISFIISNIALKETNFSIAAKESQKAFYNAQSGIECLQYWDSNYNPDNDGATKGSKSAFEYAGQQVTIYCGGTSYVVRPQFGTVNGINKIITELNGVRLGQTSANGCVDLRVERDYKQASEFSGRVRFEALGYNKCDGANRIQRGLDETTRIFFE